MTERRFLAPFVLITSLFFLWAFGVNLNDILIPHLKKAFGLTDFQSSFIQVAFFGGYFLAAFPAGRLMEKIGYKKGILTGLFLCSAGALLFLPASSSRVYGFFLFALFVMACGQSFLEVAANPYVTILGPAASAERRLNFAQSFNAVGAMLSPVVGRSFILTGVEYAPAQIAAMSAAQLDAYRAAQAGTVRGPYVLIAGIFVVIAVLVQVTHLPDVQDSLETRAREGSSGGILSQSHLVRGVIAQFFYVGAQVGVASFVIRYAQFSMPGISAKNAAWYLLLHQTGFMMGRFVGSGMMKQIAAPRLLSLFAAASLICATVAVLGSGLIPIWAVVLIGFFHSIMFPTIFALSIKNLGPLTKRGSSLLVMAIIGGAFFPAIMGRISDASSIKNAFVIPLLCYVFILYFGLSGYKPAPALGGEELPGSDEGALA
ncbi:MAG TPA: L-fucose:H+ symporter permease [Candidatus Sulfotelmatobacter sp.]|nr:L-fucose:H+ symporter permease [Candidatus Sulfotelmatobacter sp.]